MAKVCPICDKCAVSGGGYSNRIRATKYNPTGTRRRQVNLQWATNKDGKRIKICTTCIKGNKQLA